MKRLPPLIEERILRLQVPGLIRLVAVTRIKHLRLCAEASPKAIALEAQLLRYEAALQACADGVSTSPVAPAAPAAQMQPRESPHPSEIEELLTSMRRLVVQVEELRAAVVKLQGAQAAGDDRRSPAPEKEPQAAVEQPAESTSDQTLQLERAQQLVVAGEQPVSQHESGERGPAMEPDSAYLPDRPGQGEDRIPQTDPISEPRQTDGGRAQDLAPKTRSCGTPRCGNVPPPGRHLCNTCRGRKSRGRTQARSGTRVEPV